MISLKKQIERNKNRLTSPLYAMDSVFRDSNYSWPGDWEGRALLAFVCHYRLSGEEIPCMKEMMRLIPEKTSYKGYFGDITDEYADEQQLSGHGWYLRGLMEYYDCFKDERAIGYAKQTIEAMFLPILQRYENYPWKKERAVGGVSGNTLEVVDGWKLSTDVGCAFIPLDGLTRYYEVTRDVRVYSLIRVMIKKFDEIDKVATKMQTHATLSGVRGILRFYRLTGDKNYLKTAIEHFELYQREGMTLNYENYNWFDRPNTWTEPCAVVDSLLVSIDLYEELKEEKYLRLFRRIYFNGLFFCQRKNGGAGTNSCTRKEDPILRTGDIFEAPFCCSMRYAEGLLCAKQNEKYLSFEDRGVEVDEYGRYFVDDRMLVKVLKGSVSNDEFYDYNGEKYAFIPSLTDYENEEAVKIELRVIHS